MDDALDKMEENDSETSSEIAATWNSGHEELLASIADRANCSRWMHSKCQSIFEKWNVLLSIPSIVVSTIAGSATIGMPGITNDPMVTRWGTIAIGVMTLSSGVLTTINQYMKTAQNAESHRSAAVQYGKLHRVISVELAIRRDQRLNALEFLKAVRDEQDKLTDNAPHILDYVVKEFRNEFDSKKELQKPEIAGDLDHVKINRSQKSGLDLPLTPNRSYTHSAGASLSASASSSAASSGLSSSASSVSSEKSSLNAPIQPSAAV